jgi:nicotinate-nucleotide adenylyltransferase
MHIVLFGGAFNPPHLGHLIVIQQALELIDTQELWLLPDNLGSFGKKLIPPHHRLKMCQLLIQQLPEKVQLQTKLETTLIDQNLTNQTYDYFQILKQKYSNDTFSFLIGSDNLKNFKKWHHWQQLLEEIHFYVYPRSGYQANYLLKNMTLLESDSQVITNFSSTIMRRRVEQDLSLKNFIPNSIYTYIATHHLYQ